MENNEYFQSQHPVVEELLTNKYFGDTLLVCANGHLTDNKLAVGLLFPCLLTSDIFALPIENVLLVPDYTMEEIGREFEKLIIGGNCKIPTPAPPVQIENNSTSTTITSENTSTSLTSIQNERLENDNSPAELVIDDTIENGFDENCDNIEIGESNGDTIEIFVNNNEESVFHEEVTVVETDNIPPDIQVELFNNHGSNVIEEQPNHRESDNNEHTTDGDLFNIHKDSNAVATTNIEKVKEVKKKEWKQTKLKLQLEDNCANVIENLPSLPDPDNPEKTDKKELSPKKSPKKESPILHYRKPGRPKTKPFDSKSNPPKNGITRYKMKSAEWVANEAYKCAVCGKVLSCKGSYERHSRMHQDQKPYKCSYCPKTFREACKKTVHERIHSGSKPYPCNKCNKSFRTATQRIVHQRSHSDVKNFTCNVCGKGFSQPSSVKIHMARFHQN